MDDEGGTTSNMECTSFMLFYGYRSMNLAHVWEHKNTRE
jgi:hypothetical protein